MKWTAQARPADAASTLLAQEVRRAGYYPELVLGTLDVAVAGEEVVVDLVQAETTFDDAVHRHLTVLALTPSRLIIVHADDSPREDGRPGAVATSEAVPISRISSVSLTRGVCEPAAGGGQLTEMTMPDDIVIRVAAGVEGDAALARADRFAQMLSEATARAAARA